MSAPDVDMSEIDLLVEDAGWAARLPDASALVETAVLVTLGAAAAHARGPIVVLLTNDAEVRDLNSRFRGKDSATNVLSFPDAGGATGARSRWRRSPSCAAAP